MRFVHTPATLVIALVISPVVVIARTIEMNCSDMTGFAIISAEAPLEGWVSTGTAPTATNFGAYYASTIDVTQQRTMLMRFDLSQVPKDVQITRAELIIPIAYQPGTNLRFAVYRIVNEWGAGVCEKFRTRRPQEQPWAEPGAKGIGTDRAQTATQYVELTKTETDIRVNVTADLELWQSGAATNQGWLLCAEDQYNWIRIASPVYSQRAQWRLRVTYEPKR
jgi:hypothetical protein